MSVAYILALCCGIHVVERYGHRCGCKAALEEDGNSEGAYLTVLRSSRRFLKIARIVVPKQKGRAAAYLQEAQLFSW